ncbi:MAG TPA: hypothetical protein VN520_20250 [Streptomyces sp.]|uniref:hypothetical protein n=1 Tax=Streptomyces sp. TaxID=1931 RepID=UPI002CAF47D3|nr:hypothetical protein [Streptomyces sp.]HWU08680.1 hypothetical protein [Streptomyces sp.]
MAGHLSVRAAASRRDPVAGRIGIGGRLSGRGGLPRQKPALGGGEGRSGEQDHRARPLHHAAGGEFDAGREGTGTGRAGHGQFDRTYESVATTFTDGRTATCAACEVPHDEASWNRLVTGRAAGVSFVPDELPFLFLGREARYSPGSGDGAVATRERDR